jgi:hypothetical protein
MGGKEMNTGFCRGNLTQRDHFEDLNLNGKAILKSIFKKILRDVMDWIYLAQDKYKLWTAECMEMNNRIL